MTEDLRTYTDEDKETRSPKWIAPISTWLVSEESRDITGRVFQAGNGQFAVAEGWHKGPEAKPVLDPRAGRQDPDRARQEGAQERRHERAGSRLMDAFLQAAIDEARRGLAEGGIPIGSVLVHDGTIIGRGHNRRVQKGSAILHGEMDAIENAGRQPAAVYRAATVYTTLSPCAMCSGTILLYGIPRVVVGENQTFQGRGGAAALARRRGRGAAGCDLPRADAPVHRRKAGAVARGYRRGGVGTSRAAERDSG